MLACWKTNRGQRKWIFKNPLLIDPSHQALGWIDGGLGRNGGREGGQVGFREKGLFGADGGGTQWKES